MSGRLDCFSDHPIRARLAGRKNWTVMHCYEPAPADPECVLRVGSYDLFGVPGEAAPFRVSVDAGAPLSHELRVIKMPG